DEVAIGAGRRGAAMSVGSDGAQCERTGLLYVYVLGALPEDERRNMEAHLTNCSQCRQELEQLQPAVDTLVEWPTDVTRPSRDLWSQLASRIEPAPAGGGRLSAPLPSYEEPDWEQVAPGIQCKLLATDHLRSRVSMLVRLAPGADYP